LVWVPQLDSFFFYLPVLCCARVVEFCYHLFNQVPVFCQESPSCLCLVSTDLYPPSFVFSFYLEEVLSSVCPFFSRSGPVSPPLRGNCLRTHFFSPVHGRRTLTGAYPSKPPRSPWADSGTFFLFSCVVSHYFRLPLYSFSWATEFFFLFLICLRATAQTKLSTCCLLY